MDILTVLKSIDANSGLFADLEGALKATSEEVVKTGKAGTVTITLSLVNQGAGDQWVGIAETVGRTVPKKKPRGTFFFSHEGDLYKDDPRQAKMDFRTVESGNGEREVEPREKVERSIL